jgi:2-oxoglutarate ferredoxin oxidoreductase subunit alpha
VDAFHLTRRAFELADRYRMIVIILTDQFLLDSISLIDPFNFSLFSHRHFFREGRPNHPSYRFTDSGISPRIVPGHGRGFQMVDSHEHDEWGHLTEDPRLRKRMVDKRLRKLDTMAVDTFGPEIIGNPDFETLVIGWGSTCGAIIEALERLNPHRAAGAYFKQVYPLPKETADILNRAKKTVVVENNAGAQLARLIRGETGIAVDREILQYDGRPFSVESLVDQLGRIL